MLPIQSARPQKWKEASDGRTLACERCHELVASALLGKAAAAPQAEVSKQDDERAAANVKPGAAPAQCCLPWPAEG